MQKNYNRPSIGSNLQHLRENKGYSREDLGLVLKVSAAQIQRYECNVDRISAAEIYCIADLFNIPLTAFFQNIPEYEVIMPGIEFLELRRTLKQITHNQKDKPDKI